MHYGIRVLYQGRGILNRKPNYLRMNYSRLSLSRTQRDSLKYIEISVPRHIRFRELRRQNLTTKCPKFISNLTALHKMYVLKLLWKRGEIAPEDIFYLWFSFYVKRGTRISLRDKRSFEIFEV